MNKFRLTFETSWVLFLLIPVLALILVPWFFVPRKQRRGFRNTAPAVLHSLLAVILVFVLAGARLSWSGMPTDRGEEPEPEKTRDVFLIIADSGEAAETILPFLPEDIEADIRLPDQVPPSLTDLNRYRKSFSSACPRTICPSGSGVSWRSMSERAVMFWPRAGNTVCPSAI